jgi:acyl-CoA synthetase (AMP-forming)/AMP-acid ligase II
MTQPATLRFPPTADCVRYQALHRPRATALVDGARKIDFATFHRDLVRFTRALREFGLPRGSVVAVACEDFYLHWLLLLACESLGLVTVSFLVSEGRSLARLFQYVQLVLSQRDVPEAGAKARRLTREWLNAARSFPSGVGGESAVEPLALAEPQRIRRSSGTTGNYKLMVTTRAYEEQRIQAHLLSLGFTPNSKFLVSKPFTVGIMYSYATICLRMGAACIWCRDESALAGALTGQDVTHARLYQFEIPALLKRLPAGCPKPRDLTVVLSSAPVSSALWRQLMTQLAARIVFQYATNEVGPIAEIGEHGIGAVRPGVEVEVVDERGAAVPAGRIGEIRVRVPHMVDRYLGDAEATSRVFRNGWFHPGDAGVLLPSGQLKLVGRNDDDILNVGGLKLLPSQIEEIVARAAIVEDVAATTRPNADGVEEVCLAVVLAPGKSLQESGVLIRKQFAGNLGRMHFFAVGRIPRTRETGKIRRAELKKMLAPK